MKLESENIEENVSQEKLTTSFSFGRTIPETRGFGYDQCIRRKKKMR